MATYIIAISLAVLSTEKYVLNCLFVGDDKLSFSVKWQIYFCETCSATPPPPPYRLSCHICSLGWLLEPCVWLRAGPIQCLPCRSLWLPCHCPCGLSVRYTWLHSRILLSYTLDDVPNIQSLLRLWTQNHLQCLHACCAAAFFQVALYSSRFRGFCRVRCDVCHHPNHTSAFNCVWLARGCPRFRLFVLHLRLVFHCIPSRHCAREEWERKTQS